MVARAQMPDFNPPKELDVFNKLIGSWEATVKWDMMGEKMDSLYTLKVEREGQFIKMTSVMDMMGMKMTETQFTGWNAGKKKYESWAYSNWAPTPRHELGIMDGTKFISTSDPWEASPGEMTEGRFTMDLKSDKEFPMILEFKMEGKWTTVATGTFKRKS
jgi:hypothetical protein